MTVATAATTDQKTVPVATQRNDRTAEMPTATAATAASWVPRISGSNSASAGIPRRSITRTIRRCRRGRLAARSSAVAASFFSHSLRCRRPDHHTMIRSPNQAASATVSRLPVTAAMTTGTVGRPATMPAGITTTASSQGSAPPGKEEGAQSGPATSQHSPVTPCPDGMAGEVYLSEFSTRCRIQV